MKIVPKPLMDLVRYWIALFLVIIEGLVGKVFPEEEIIKKEPMKYSKRPYEKSSSASSDALSEETAKPNRIGRIILEFRMNYRTEYGQSVHLIGSESFLGQWNSSSSKGMICKGDDIQKVRIKLPLQKRIGDGAEFFRFEYKYLLKDSRNGSITWESGGNRMFFSKEHEEKTIIYKVDDVWNNPQLQKISKKDVVASDAKAFVVLGKKLEPDGSPNSVLQGRMAYAAMQFLEDPSEEKIMIVTGGKTQGSNCISEAEAMKTLALKYGVPDASIILEEYARNTIENAVNTKEILEDKGIQEVVVITSDFHMERSKRIFKALLDSDYIMEFKEAFPNEPMESLLKEQMTEASMLIQLRNHLKYYEE